MNAVSFEDLKDLRHKKWFIAVLELATSYDALDAEHPLDLDGKEVKHDLGAYGLQIAIAEAKHQTIEIQGVEWKAALDAAALCVRYALQKQDYIKTREKPGRIK